MTFLFYFLASLLITGCKIFIICWKKIKYELEVSLKFLLRHNTAVFEIYALSTVETGPEPVATSHGRKSRRQTPTAKESSVEKPPFMTYGWADKELDTCRKFTHNVKANNEYVRNPHITPGGKFSPYIPHSRFTRLR